MTIKELELVTIIALKEGSVDAFNLCYDLYFKVLCSFANFFVRNPDVAEEITQNVLLEVWVNREKLPVQGSLKSYLMTAVRHDCLDHLKHKKIEERYVVNYLSIAHERYDHIINNLVDEDLQKSLDMAITKLPPHCREIFLMSRFKYMPYKDIASALNISVKTVENQIGKALKIVRKEMDPFL